MKPVSEPTPLTKEQESKTDFDTTEIEKISVLIATKIDKEILGGDHPYDRGLIAKMIYEGFYNFTAKTIKDYYQQGFSDGSDLTGRIGEESYQERIHEAILQERSRVVEWLEENTYSWISKNGETNLLEALKKLVSEKRTC